MIGGVHGYTGHSVGQQTPCVCFISYVSLSLEDLVVLIGIGLKITRPEVLKFIKAYSKSDSGSRAFNFPFTEEELEPFKYKDCVDGIDWGVRREYENLPKYEAIRKEYFRNLKIDKII
jgi:hypothetical protein